jgi:hypothetical protein
VRRDKTTPDRARAHAHTPQVRIAAAGWRSAALTGKMVNARGNCPTAKEAAMSVAKVVEITSDSNESFEHAIRTGIERAERSLNNVRGAWISEQKVVVEDGSITRYRVTMRVSFVLDD